MKNILLYIVKISTLLTILGSFVNGLYSIIFLPITFIFLYFIVQRKDDIKNRNYYVFSKFIILILLWVRLVMIPLFGFISSKQPLYLQNDTAYGTACLLCCYDSIFIVFIYLFVIRFKIKKFNLFTDYNNIKLSGNKYIYIIIILFSLILFILIGRHLHLFEFGIKQIGLDERSSEEVVGMNLIIRRIISMGYLLLFFLLINHYKNKYKIHHKDSYVYMSIILACLMTCIIVGERRTSQIYISFSCVWLLISIYPSYTKRISKYVFGTALFVIIMMSIYKHFNAYLYESYSDALEANSGSISSPGVLDSYFFGIGTIFKNLQFADDVNLTFTTLIYDFCRSIFGLNFLVKGSGENLTTELYNLYLYNGTQKTGYLMSSVGYGYLYFGLILAPIFSGFNVLMMMFFEKCMRKSKSIEFRYLFAYVFMRFAFGVLGAPTPLINMATQQLFTTGLVCYMSSKIKITL